MTSYYFVSGTLAQTKLTETLEEIYRLDPDHLIVLCLEEYDYNYIFDEFFAAIQPYLVEKNKKLILISSHTAYPLAYDNITIEDSYGCYYLAVCTVHDAIDNLFEFKFTDNTKLYTNYNNNSKYQRAMLVDELTRVELLDRGIVTLVNTQMTMPNGEYYQYKYHSGDRLLDEPDFILNSNSDYMANKFPKSYLNGFIDIVSESTYDEGAMFITEKTAKPIGALKPFLVFGPVGINQHLQERYGLEYYDELFDYSFDAERHIEKRIEKLVQNLVRLSKCSMNELKEMHASIKDKLIRNRNIFLSHRHDWEKTCPKSLRFMLNLNSDTVFYGDMNSSIFEMVKRKH